ncbi:MAG: Arm DNA-binding domain-containing protein [Candidatus Macondimonas sp.]
MPLTATAIRNTKPGEKTIKLFNGRGLYLEVSPAGRKWWRLYSRVRRNPTEIHQPIFMRAVPRQPRPPVTPRTPPEHHPVTA